MAGLGLWAVADSWASRAGYLLSYEATWFLAFLMTQGIEVPLYMRFGGLSFLRALAPSAIPHPIVWFVFFHPAVPLSWLEKFILAEIFAWLAEAAYLSWSRPRIRACPSGGRYS